MSEVKCETACPELVSDKLNLFVELIEREVSLFSKYLKFHDHTYNLYIIRQIGFLYLCM